MNYDEVIREFLVQSYEDLDQLDRALVQLETDPHDTGLLASIFRTIHTIKGTGGFLGYSRLEAVSHVGENLLSRLRDGEFALTPAITSTLLRMVDAIRGLLAAIETTGQENDADYSELVAELQAHYEPAAVAAVAAPAAPSLSQMPLAEAAAFYAAKAAAEAAKAAATAAPTPVPAVPAAPAVVAEAAEAVSTPADTGAAGDRRQTGDRRTGDDRRSRVAESTLRVDVGLLDRLMTLVGELVLARNQILQCNGTTGDATFTKASQRLNLVTSELQEAVMRTRMQPIDNVWSKFPRIVRDLAATCGKQVRLEMSGRETELDKTLLEAIGDPLTHIVRNSVDHGIESPAVRVERGKPAEGVLRLHAFHEGGHVNVTIVDDGGGIDPVRIRNKAVQRGLITAEQAARLSDNEAVRLIFVAGFSTAEAITNVSGRGVGMDVVRTNIENIGGTVDVHSVVGEGTTLRIKIPLTLAIIPALLVTAGGERFAIPQVALVELVRLEGEHRAQAVERIGGSAVYRLRGRLLPLIGLVDALGLGSSENAPDPLNIVVLKADDRQFGLVVEAIQDTEEIVVKPLSKQLKRVQAFAGATIMGDGSVALILDVPGLAQLAGLNRPAERAAATAAQGRSAGAADEQMLLVLQAAGNRRVAMPLSMVDRLEEFETGSIERSGDSEVVQYRDQILSLVDLSSGDPTRTVRHVVVVRHDGRVLGIQVDGIVDVVSQALTVRTTERRPGVLGAAVIQERVTELLDIGALTRGVAPVDDVVLELVGTGWEQ